MANQQLMPCGHPGSAVVSSGEGTAHCGECAERSQHSTPRADVLAEEYKGTYLWAELDKARARIADLEEQLETTKRDAADFYNVSCVYEDRIKELREALERVDYQITHSQGSGQAQEIARAALASFPAWKYGDPIKATMTVSNPATVFDTPEATLYEDGVLRIQESTPAKGHPMLGVSEMHSDAHSPASEPKA